MDVLIFRLLKVPAHVLKHRALSHFFREVVAAL